MLDVGAIHKEGDFFFYMTEKQLKMNTFKTTKISKNTKYLKVKNMQDIQKTAKHVEKLKKTH